MKLLDILRVKGDNVLSIEISATLADVVARLVDHNCGSLVVLEDGKMAGIITERDILRASNAHDVKLNELSVTAVMTRDVVTGKPEDTVDDTMGLLTRRRIRHLPVLDGDNLAGMISIGDLVKAYHDRLAVENEYLKTYIQS